MRGRWLAIVGALLSALAVVPIDRAGEAPMTTDEGPYARIAFLRPRDGNTVDFEAGYARHLEWHRQAKDPFAWYGWSIWAGERQRWLVYATFGHSAASFDRAVSPAEDERDNVANVMPHADFAGGGVYEFLPELSRGGGVPEATARLELTTVDLVAGAERSFESSVAAVRSGLRGDALWYRMVAGGPAPRYVRLRPRPTLAAILDGASEQRLPDDVRQLVVKMTIEILSFRPTLSYGVPAGKP